MLKTFALRLPPPFSSRTLDVVVAQSETVFEMHPESDKALNRARDALDGFDLGLDIVDGVSGCDCKFCGLARDALHENLHATTFMINQMLMLCLREPERLDVNGRGHQRVPRDSEGP